MEKLLSNSSLPASETVPAADDPIFLQNLLSAMKDLQSATPTTPQTSTSSSSNPPTANTATETKPTTKASFQSTIDSTISKLHTSSSTVESEIKSAAAAAAGKSGNLDGLVDQDETLKQMLSEFENLMGNGENGEFEELFKSMMDNLYTKDMLFEPLVDLNSKYPAWLEKNKSSFPVEEYTKYESQHSIITQIIKIFESGNDTAEESKKVSELMVQSLQMQEYGNPPEEILKDLAPGLDFGPDGIPKGMGTDCGVQ
ncbi:Peroxisome chaperone and import receptor [Nowakowskiella sp. JEL0407]|nr:Peroxisome chaperone and import receptor [Nowakowskiella sp. JEL0407]